MHHDRFKKFISIVFTGKTVSALLFIYGIFSFVRDEFLSPAIAEKLRLGGLFSVIDWYWWIFLGLIVWALSVAWEAAKHRNTKESNTLETKKVDKSTNVVGKQKAQQIINIFGDETKINKEKDVDFQKPDEQLELWVDRGSHIYPSKGSDEFVICLAVNVISQEKQKILDLDAHLASIDRLTEESANIWHHLPFVRKNRLEWEDGSYQVELKPGIHELKKLKIAILNCTSREFRFADEDMPRIFPYHQGNAIYRIRIKFSGKLEGNLDYKHYDYEKEFISVPEQSKLDFLPNAARFQELPEKFMEMLKTHLQSKESSE